MVASEKQQPPLRIAGRFVATSLLAETGLSVVHRAEDLERGETVCLKLLKKEAIHADPAALVRFRREATLLAGLSHPHIVQVHAFGLDDGQPYLVTEMIAGRPLDELIAEGLVERTSAVRLLAQLADGLAYVHRRGLVHRDIKPANVLVTADLQVKLIDFGLAQLEGGGDAAAVGTFRYMPPEQAGLLQRPVGPRSDLYSLGVTAYEMLSGRLPFAAADDGELLRLIQSAPPASLRGLVADIPVALERIVEKLLQKNPDDRYHTAHGLHADLARVLADLDGNRAIASFDLDQSGSALYEKLGTIFVGRERELAACEQLLGEVSGGQPRFILVSGRSGVGKSAFVNEIHARGLSRGLQVAQGKCYAIHAGLPYFVLAEALEGAHALLAQMPAAQRLQVLARLVKDVAPDHIVALAPVWRDIFPRAAAPKYEGEEKERAALVKSVGALIACLSSKEAPLALFLDDLQWADSGTITLLDRLVLELAGRPVLLVGAFRSEEVGPAHPVSGLRARIESKDVAGVAFEIAPLTKDEVAALVQRLLSRPAPADLVAELHERSGGNAFFVWELLRAFLNGGVIAERAGGETVIDLKLLTTIELPSGLLDVVIRRLRALPPTSQRLLGVAAMVGQAFSLEILTAVLELDADAVYDALVAAIDAGLVVPQGDVYAFAHDKVLEAAAEIVPPAERPALHRRLGDFIEKQHPGGDENPERIFELAEHFGRSDDDERGLAYAKRAGDKARALLQNDAALRHYARADEILARRAEGASERGEILVKRAEVLDTMGKYADAEDGYSRALVVQATPIKTATVLAKLAYMQQKASRMAECHANLLKALALLGVTLDLRSAFALPLARLRLFIVKQRVRFFPPVARAGDERAVLVNEILTRLWYFHAFHDAGKHNVKMYVLACRLLAATLSGGDSKDLSTAHRLMAITLCQGNEPDFAGSVENSLRSVEVARKLQLKMELAVGYCYVGVVHVWQNRAAKAIEYLERAQEMLEQIGNLWDLVNAHIFLYMALRARGQLDKALAHALEIVAIAERANAPASLASGAMKVGELLVLMGETERGEQQLDRAVAITTEKKLAFDGFNANKIKGRLLIRAGKPAEARAWFEKAIALTETNNFMRAYVYEAYIGWADSVVRDDAATPDLLDKADRQLTLCEDMEQRYRNYLVYCLRVRARFQARRGDRAGAEATLGRARDIVEREDLVFERPLVLEDTAELVPGQEALRAKARELYQAMGQKGEAQRLAPRESGARDDVRTESLLASLLDVTVATALQRDLGEQARACLDALVRVFDAERAFLFLADENGGALTLQAGRDREQKDLAALTAYSTTVVEKVRSEKKPIVITSTEDGALLGSQSAVVYNLRSIMAAPLMLRDKLLGVVYLDNRLERGLRTATELQVFQAIASQIAVFIETSRAANVEMERQVLASEKALLEKDMALTATVQQLFLPKEADFSRGGIEIAGFYRSATQCGGDWWWLETRRPGSLVVLVGDVMGHGAAPAMVTASVSTAYQLATRQHFDRPVPELLEELNANLVGLCMGRYYMTMSAVEIHDDGLVRWWNAGAPPLLVLDASGKAKPVSARGSPLGAGALTLGTAEVRLERGQRLFIFTDGLSELELPDGKMLGLGKLGRTFAQLAAEPIGVCRDRIVEALDTARGEVSQKDDLTFVLLHRG